MVPRNYIQVSVLWHYLWRLGAKEIIKSFKELHLDKSRALPPWNYVQMSQGASSRCVCHHVMTFLGQRTMLKWREEKSCALPPSCDYLVPRNYNNMSWVERYIQRKLGLLRRTGVYLYVDVSWGPSLSDVLQPSCQMYTSTYIESVNTFATSCFEWQMILARNSDTYISLTFRDQLKYKPCCWCTI